ncbi:hypothetical protein GCM10022393_22610 [Aquimarina addita]|uniref:Uncharacterized protein n=1 Tax=Aquimarina addita TaxID=870485 RepID=A0ABP6UM33_9FLAO
MRVKMDGDKEWNQYLLDKSVSEHLISIGATLIISGKISDEQIATWGDTRNA